MSVFHLGVVGENLRCKKFVEGACASSSERINRHIKFCCVIVNVNQLDKRVRESFSQWFHVSQRGVVHNDVIGDGALQVVG